nr:immunoglobulin light chain junction region [Macaca mulatta]MOV37719.1 immunoglobulin light chain junction region [Macaca mulatta]
CLQYDDEPLTF